MAIDCELNAKVLAYLSRNGTYHAMIAVWDSVANPYYRCGCHPEIVERLWDQIGNALPVDSRALVYGIPALVQPKSEIILAIGMGTQYGLRLRPSLIAAAIEAGAPTTTTWSGGSKTDIRAELGDDWIFGRWKPQELDWCLKTDRILITQEAKKHINK